MVLLNQTCYWTCLLWGKNIHGSNKTVCKRVGSIEFSLLKNGCSVGLCVSDMSNGGKSLIIVL